MEIMAHHDVDLARVFFAFLAVSVEKRKLVPYFTVFSAAELLAALVKPIELEDRAPGSSHVSGFFTACWNIYQSPVR